MVKVSGNLTPIDLHLIDLHFQLTNGYCMDIKTFSQGIHFELNVNFGWRTCGLGLLEWISTNNKSLIETCPMQYYGTNADGNSLPVWEFDFLDYLNQNIDWYSFCLPNATADETAAKPTGALCV